MLSRSIVINLEKPTKGEIIAFDKITLTEEFMKDRATIFGGIISILIEVLKYYEPNSVPRDGKDIRMASFYDYGYYICEAWKDGEGEIFCKQYIDLLENQMKRFI